MCLSHFDKEPKEVPKCGWKAFRKTKIKGKTRLCAIWAFRPNHLLGDRPGTYEDQYPLKIYSQNRWNSADFKAPGRGIHVFLNYADTMEELVAQIPRQIAIRKVKLGKVLATGTIDGAKAAVVDSIYIYDKRHGDEDCGPIE